MREFCNKKNCFSYCTTTSPNLGILLERKRFSRSCKGARQMEQGVKSTHQHYSDVKKTTQERQAGVKAGHSTKSGGQQGETKTSHHGIKTATKGGESSGTSKKYGMKTSEQHGTKGVWEYATKTGIKTGTKGGETYGTKASKQYGTKTSWEHHYGIKRTATKTHYAAKGATKGHVCNTLVAVKANLDKIQKLSNTAGFESQDLDDILITRRGCSIPLLVRVTAKKVKMARVDRVMLEYCQGDEEQIELELQRVDFLDSGASIEVKIPATAPVAVYHLIVEGQLKDGRRFEAEMKGNVLVLFNAWCEEDQVYLDSEAQRQEYVSNTRGILYTGGQRGKPWNLALYRPYTMRAVLFLCQKLSKLSFKERADPVLVSREMSALVNVQDDNGILWGRWDGDYADGVRPEFWQGSGAILEEFVKSGGKPVKYGQCWVFSGVLLSVLRVLGIPSRSVTNYNSAHDTNCNRSVDEYYTSDGKPVDYLSTGNDSVWNFHVWNESWMQRPDLPQGFGGWQAVDATPQERSPLGGGYRSGPTPIRAVKEGLSLMYDTNFVIAEVNADVKRYRIGEDGVPKLYEVDTHYVGKSIITKSIGDSNKEDITSQYKYKEGSAMERKALYHDMEKLQEMTSDVEFTVVESDYEFGDDITFTVKAYGKADNKKICGKIECTAITYTGRDLGKVDTLDVDVDVCKGKTNMIEMKVHHSVFSMYKGVKVYLKFQVSLAVVGTSQLLAQTVCLTAQPPSLQISGPRKLSVGRKVKLLIQFKNPLPVAMQNVILNIDMDGMKDNDVVQNVGTIGPNGVMWYPLIVTPVKVGQYSIVAGLSSDKVELVSGELDVEVFHFIPPEVLELDMLEVVSVDLHQNENSSAHHTDKFHHSGLVVRRGQAFTISITTNKPMPKGARVATRASFQLISKRRHRSEGSFQLDVLSSVVKGTTATFELEPPADVCVGQYSLVLTVDQEGTVEVLKGDINVIILFNPWCTEDACSYPNVSDLEEYVLNTSGKIWVGSATSNHGRPWQFAQFTDSCLEVVLWLMDRMNTNDRANPIQVSRFISAITNVQDDDGILVGNWSGDYSNGTPPLKWTGSGAILAEFNKTKSPVSFGQCWVFSGVQTSLLRCLGLPARSVTNFNSAHDTNFNRAVDKFFDTDGKSTHTSDSVWNFHVWNEAWMSRPDLQPGFGGWQALDATPQEESLQGGGYRLGPAPVRAIKLGMRMNYDVEFTLSEVNADIRSYTEMEDGSQVLSEVNTSRVGKQISTKAVGSGNLDDITINYKFPEGTASERAAVLAETESQKNIGVDIQVDPNISIGDDFTITATATNKSNSDMKLITRIICQAVYYTGAPGQEVKAHSWMDSLLTGNKKDYKLQITYREYLRILDDGNFLSVACLVVDKNSLKAVVKTETIRLKTPDIAIDLPEGGFKLHQPEQIAVSFKNPLKEKLTECQFEIRGDNHVQDTVVNVPTVYGLQTAKALLKTIPVRKGRFQLQVVFSSTQLTDIIGDEEVTVA